MNDTLCRLNALGAKISLDDEELVIDAPKNALTPDLVAVIKQQKSEIIRELRCDLNFWLKRIRQARTKDEIFTILDKYRPLNWTDQQRAQMSQTYIPRLITMLDET